MTKTQPSKTKPITCPYCKELFSIPSLGQLECYWVDGYGAGFDDGQSAKDASPQRETFVVYDESSPYPPTESPSPSAVDRGEDNKLSKFDRITFCEALRDALDDHNRNEVMMQETVDDLSNLLRWLESNQESPHIVPPETVLVDCLASALETLEKYRTLVVEDQKNGAKFRLGEHAEVTIASIQKRLAEARVSLLASDESTKTAEALKFLRSRVVGFLASNNVYRVIDGEILKYDSTYQADTRRMRKKTVIDRNDRIQELEKELAELRDLIYGEDGYIESQKVLMKENATLRENREFWRLKAMEADGKFAELRERMGKYEEGK